MTICGVGELTAMEHVDQMQHKAHAQAQVNHTQAGAGHVCTNGPCKQVQVMRERLFLLHNRTDLWYRIALKETPYVVRCRHKAFGIIWCAELLVKKKEREESVCMCMRIYMCDM